METKKLGILLADSLSDELQPEFSSYTRIFERFVSDFVSDTMQIRAYEAFATEFPVDLDECDAYLITGSQYSVYDDLPWIHLLFSWIREAFAAKKPLIGICFGHQAIAQALGGEVKAAESGWVVGAPEYDRVMENGAWRDLPEKVRLLASHKDQVVQLPNRAVNLLKTKVCKHAGFYIDDHVLTMQFHPEFDVEFLSRLMKKREKELGGKYPEAIESMNNPLDRDQIGNVISKFLSCRH